MELKVIAYARNGHTDKFGIPRQSRDDSPILTRIVFEKDFAVREALRGIEGFSHLWLLWGFDKVQSDKVQSTKDGLSWSPTVRPPRLGGNKRMGVFATRSPFRPNPIGLSSVRLVKVLRDKVQSEKGSSLELIVSGADLMDGTPIYDIKPYLEYCDCHPDATNGFAEETKEHCLEVDWSMVKSRDSLDIVSTKSRYSLDVNLQKSRSLIAQLTYILQQDPRPGYQDDPDREYRLDFAGYTTTFVVKDQKIVVKNIDKH
ncbi:MAG: tRNA (N6-threonylcarbamoyladenosine(37)-N6)-methyltransferase TrmO [Paludibacteraceae bacterium]|nr:tRNA (N6-threonylcarbamoyladenosine(37)-N6)-methyltransferase TrmO [Paludibacteraceae bacterium]